ncbi:hypothetical protein Dsin_003288 [Dipteronia sinensis]|uniref:Uncharacterized protein n=1 Tax=Dipteronia sinensis TaxID=43782 RepID=A0AAE0B7R4_9ROSI|nr:hypothetical protein Dsin_003288 [Dipteronia sinensis]
MVRWVVRQLVTKDSCYYQKLKAAKNRLNSLNRSCKVSLVKPNQVEEKLSLIDTKAAADGWTEILRKERFQLLKKLWRSLRREEQSWWQKSRINWLLKGDKNTKFFQCMANGRRRRNAIEEGDRVGILGFHIQMQKASLPITYLGFPLGGNPGSKNFWEPLINRIEKMLAPWKRKFLTKWGRLVLIKAVISSIPNYFLSVFKIPVGVAQRIEKLQRSFLWGDGTLKRKIHAVRWVEVCKSKRNGGLGIWRILDKNKTLLAKWIWRFGREENVLWRRIICSNSRVNQGEISWDWHASKHGSFFVKSIESLFKFGSTSAKVISKGFVTVVGRGDRAKFWYDIIVEGGQLKEAFPRCFALAANKSGVVQDFGVWTGSNQIWSWLIPTRRPPFDWEKDQWNLFLTFLECFPIRRLVSDALAWSFDSKGLFTVGSYRKALDTDQNVGVAVPGFFFFEGFLPSQDGGVLVEVVERQGDGKRHHTQMRNGFKLKHGVPPL